MTCKTVEGPNSFLASSLGLRCHIDFNFERDADSGTVLRLQLART